MSASLTALAGMPRVGRPSSIVVLSCASVSRGGAARDGGAEFAAVAIGAVADGAAVLESLPSCDKGVLSVQAGSGGKRERQCCGELHWLYSIVRIGMRNVRFRFSAAAGIRANL